LSFKLKVMNLFKSWFRQSGRGLKCAAVTPVGPGHAARARECRSSIEAAWRENTGPFSQLDFFFVDDGAGSLGRSKARNVGVQDAQRAGADWIFFLDADDLMTPRAFSIFSEYSNEFDAVWGLMAIKPPNEAEHHIRFPQALTLRSVDELLLLDPFMTLLMGHFVRTSVALQLPFDESMDAGEDFDYYIRAWEKYRCIKVAQVLSVNRSDLHSSGPRSATADQWRAKATARLSAGLEKNSLHRSSSRAIAALNRCSEEAQAFSRARDEATRDNVIPLSRRLPYRGFVDVSGYAGGDFVLFNNNDDPAALNIGWTGEYAPAAARLWQALAAGTPTILDISASTGYFGLLAARAAPAAAIVCLEPLLLNYARLELNLALNDVRNVRALHAAAARADAVGALHVFGTGDVLPVDSALHASGRPFARIENVATVNIDNFIKQEGGAAPGLIKIAAGGDEDEIMAGMAQTLSVSRPDLLIATTESARAQRIDADMHQHGYQLYGIDENSSSVVAFERLPPGAVNGTLYCWATTRSRDDVARILASADCNSGVAADC
jgi:FkbM family methyltransferase